MRFYEQGLPQSNHHEALELVTLGENNHVQAVYLDLRNEYGIRIVLECWSEHDEATYYYSIRDHKGDICVAKIDDPITDLNSMKQVWNEQRPPEDSQISEAYARSQNRRPGAAKDSWKRS